MDPLRAEAAEHHRRESPGERLRQALEMMREGYALKLGNLRRQHPHATEQEVEALLQAWAEQA